jgi:hypothetical protein
MKKLGILIFAVALILGIVVTSMFSVGKAAGSIFHFNIDWKGGVKGSGNVITDKRDVSGFHGVEVGGIYQVEITAQKEFGVTVEADDNIAPLVKTEVENGILKIESEGRISPKSTIRIVIAAPDVDSLDISGVANVTVNNVRNDALAIDSSGASKISLNGETSKLKVDVSGAVKVDAGELKAADATVDANGASNVLVNVSGTLKADASGASHINYSGTPSSVQKSTTGVANISPR